MQACVLIPEPSLDVDELEFFHMSQGVRAHMSIAASLQLSVLNGTAQPCAG